MTKEQVLDISQTLIKLKPYRDNFRMRAQIARRIFRLRKQIAENAANVQTNAACPLP